MKKPLPSRHEIALTLDYAAFFKSRLTIKQLHHWLISPQKFTLSQLKKSLSFHPQLKKKILSRSSVKQKKLYQQKLASIKRFLNLLKFFPTIKLVGLTGSLAVLNSTPDDDIDLLIITAPHTLWFTRLILFPFLLFFRHRHPNRPHRSNDICLNLWLDSSSLILPSSRQNLYTAHELLQMKPLINRSQTYSRLLHFNSWVSRYLATAYHLQTKNISPLAVPHQSFFLLLYPFNFLAFLFQSLYMSSKKTIETVTLSQAFFHPQDIYSRLPSRLRPHL